MLRPRGVHHGLVHVAHGRRRHGDHAIGRPVGERGDAAPVRRGDAGLQLGWRWSRAGSEAGPGIGRDDRRGVSRGAKPGQAALTWLGARALGALLDLERDALAAVEAVEVEGESSSLRWKK